MLFELTPTTAALLFGAGLLAGFVNVLAGGGGLIGMPALIFTGLDATVANGTFRIALVFQNTSGLLRYRRAGLLPWEDIKRFAPPTVLGATAGAWLGAQIDGEIFRLVFAGVMVVAAAVLVLNPTARLERGEPGYRPPVHLAWPALAAAGFYGGFVQAGVGFALLAALTLVCRRDLVTANIIKLALVLAYTPIALLLFGVAGRVHLVAGLALAGGQTLGAWVGAGAALRRGVLLIRVVVALGVVATALRLVGVF